MLAHAWVRMPRYVYVGVSPIKYASTQARVGARERARARARAR